MHLSGVTAKQLAAEAGWHEKYLSAVQTGIPIRQIVSEIIIQAEALIEIRRPNAADD